MQEWEEKNGVLLRRFRFADFAEALVFTNKVGALAEEAQHHPDISLGWGYVEIRLTTHDAENTITQKDIDMVQKIDILDATN